MLQVLSHGPSNYFDCATDHFNSLKMPVDFASYLLAASPPHLDFFGYDDEFHNKGYSVKCRVACRPLKPIIIMKPKTFDDSESTSLMSSPTSECSSDEEDETSDFIFSSGLTQSEISQRNMSKKRVTFADARGLSLTKVKVMTESSDMPPKLQPQLLASLTQGASAGVSQAPPLSLEFPQPASDYMNFRLKLNTQNVSLENVILKDYNVMGTIKVKNLSFNKNVFVRCSFDSWKSSMDIVATYVPCGADDSSAQVMYDTFSFEITVPSTLKLNQAVEFCICYECDEGQFWDSAEGRNYKVVSTYSVMSVDTQLTLPSDKPYTSDFKPNFDYVDSWSEYSSWSHVNRETPYY
ncbi:protein phosphatase 1 regulatory subunit 3B-like [Lineus longissimus]|uniref:protein phosphatase 1 regulatory subunit 3B-like n=1 Tax=Lineus longissimus TaxID=88925 RepID=UPI00315D7FAB